MESVAKFSGRAVPRLPVNKPGDHCMHSRTRLTVILLKPKARWPL